MEVIKRYDKCIWCKKTLVPIGYDRSNGKKHIDWSDRSSHKKCWVENELKLKKKRPEGNEYKNVICIEIS